MKDSFIPAAEGDAIVAALDELIPRRLAKHGNTGYLNWRNRPTADADRAAFTFAEADVGISLFELPRLMPWRSVCGGKENNGRPGGIAVHEADNPRVCSTPCAVG